MTKKSATQDKGVLDNKSKESSTEEIEAKVDTSALDFMEQIVDKNEESEAKEEINLAKEEGRKPAEWATDRINEKEIETKKEVETEIETKKEEEIETKKEEEIETETKKEEMITIIVDGEKREVPLSEVKDAGIRTLQKESAADSRLEEATKLLKDAKKVVKLPIKKEEDTATIETVEERKSRLAKLRSEMIHATQYGSEEEAAIAVEKWEEAIQTPAAQQATAITTEDVKNIINTVNLESRINASPEQGGYSDLMNNPILRAQTGALVDNLVESGKGSYNSFETYKQAGDAIRLIGSTLDPEYKAPEIKKSSDTFEQKREKKKSIDVIPTASQKAPIASEKEDREQTASEVIAEMRKQRGQ